VWAVNKVAALALYYHAVVNQSSATHQP